MRIKYIIPFPFDEEGDRQPRRADPAASSSARTPRSSAFPCATRGARSTRYYEALVFDMYIAEAGLRAEEEGYDAVIMDTVSDSGLWALRSRLTIPVFGPGIVSYASRSCSASASRS